MNPIRFATKDSRVSHVSRWSWRQPISCSSYSSRWSNSDGQELKERERDLGRENPEMDTWWHCWGGVIPETVPKLLSQPLIQSNCLSGVKNCVLATETIFSPCFERNNQEFLKWEKNGKRKTSEFLFFSVKHQGGQRVQLKNKSTGCRQKLDDLWCCSSLQRQPALRRCRRPTFWGVWAALIWFGWNGSNSAPSWCPPGLKILSLFVFFAVISSDLSASF